MKLPPKLKPFWYVPEYQDDNPPVRFQLRPLTQEEVVEVEGMYEHDESGRMAPKITMAARFRAAMLSIVGCDGIVNDKDEPIRWPHGIDVQGEQSVLLRSLICLAGLRIIYEMDGTDWKAFVEKVDLEVEGKQPAEVDAAKI